MLFKQYLFNTRLGEVLRAFKAELIAVGVFSMVINILMLTPTFYMLHLFDHVFISRSNLTLYALSLVGAFLLGIIAVTEILRSRLLVRAGIKFDLSLNGEVFQAAFAQKIKQGGVDVAAIFIDLAKLRQFLTSNAVFAFFDAPWTPIYILVSYLLHPILGLTALIFTLMLILFAWLNQRWTENLNQKIIQDAREDNEFLLSKIRNVETIEAMGMSQNLLAKWKQRHCAVLDFSDSAQDRISKLQSVMKFMQYAMQSLTLAVGAILVIDNQLSAGSMIAATLLVSRALQPIQLMVSTWAEAYEVKISLGRLDDLLKQNPVRLQRVVRVPSAPLVEVKGLSAVAAEKAILKDINFTVKSGDVVVISGASGSGKSTLAKCILGLWDEITSGQVDLDGTDIRCWDRTILGPYLGYLPQDVQLLDGNIAQNIARFGEVDSDQVIRAAQNAGIHELILRLPMGYDTQLGAALPMSGGQRQRLALARAVYGQPMLLILDEPNSNLDEAGELALYKLIAQWRNDGHTVILISHRPNAFDIADKIMVLSSGQIQFYGSKTEFKSLSLH